MMIIFIILTLIIKFAFNTEISTTSYSPKSFYDYYKTSKKNDNIYDTFPIELIDAVKIAEETSTLKSMQIQISQDLQVYTTIGLIYDKLNSSQSLSDFSNDFLDIYYNKNNIAKRNNSLFALFKIKDGEFVVITGDNITSDLYTNEIKEKMEKSIENKNYTGAIENFLNGLLEYADKIQASRGMTRDAKILISVLGVAAFSLLIIIIVCVIWCVRSEIDTNNKEKLLKRIEKFLNGINMDYVNPCLLTKDTCMICLEKLEEIDSCGVNLKPVVRPAPVPIASGPVIPVVPIAPVAVVPIGGNEVDQNKLGNTIKNENNQTRIQENGNNNMDNNPASDVRLEVKIIENQEENPSIISANQKDFSNLGINENKLGLSNNKSISNDININKNINNNINMGNPKPTVNNSINSFHCRHRFHKNCIEKFIIKYNVCPLCRERFELEWNGIIIRKKVVNILKDYYEYLKNFKFDVDTKEIKYTQIIIAREENAHDVRLDNEIAISCLNRCCMWGPFYWFMNFILSKILSLCVLLIECCKECCR